MYEVVKWISAVRSHDAKYCGRANIDAGYKLENRVKVIIRRILNRYRRLV